MTPASHWLCAQLSPWPCSGQVLGLRGALASGGQVTCSRPSPWESTLLWGRGVPSVNGNKWLSPALSEHVGLLATEPLLVTPWSSRCSKELNQWEALTEYGQSKGHINPYLVLECAWRVSNWTAMKEALVQVRPLSHVLVDASTLRSYPPRLCGFLLPKPWNLWRFRYTKNKLGILAD